MHYVIEKIENHTACLTPLHADATPANTQHRPCSELPKGIKEGDVLLQTNTGYQLDRALTAERLDQLTQRLDNLFKRSQR